MGIALEIPDRGKVQLLVLGGILQNLQHSGAVISTLKADIIQNGPLNLRGNWRKDSQSF